MRLRRARGTSTAVATLETADERRDAAFESGSHPPPGGATLAYPADPSGGSPTTTAGPVGGTSDAAPRVAWRAEPGDASRADETSKADEVSGAEAASRTVEPHRELRLGEVLVAAGAVTPAQVDAALRHQRETGARLGECLVELGATTERAMIEALGTQLKRPVVDLRREVPEPAAVARLPEAVAREFDAVPVRETAEGLQIAVADVVAEPARQVLETAVGGPVVLVLAPYGEIRRVVNHAYAQPEKVAHHVEAFRISMPEPEVLERAPRLEVDEHAPVVQVVNLLLTQALRERASDVHIEPQEDAVRVRLRVDGVLREITTLPQAMAQALISRIKIMADLDIVERRRAQDGQITFTIDGRSVDVRVATISTIWGEKAVLRLLDAEESLRTLAELGMTTETVGMLRELVHAPFGMIACAGPTGSGKTTTLYAALSEINDPQRNITTIEDPVEYRLPLLNQIQINELAGITFANALKAILRQDPDVILVGEVRDVETARIAVQSALTGHLVLSSLHATDAATALHRLRDMGIESYLLSSAISAVVSQRLVRRICEHCRETYEPSVAERALFERVRGAAKERFVRGAGCNICSQTGYLGRVGAYELLRVTEEVRSVLVSDGSVERLHQTAVAQGLRPLRYEVLRMVEDDTTTIAEAIRCISGII